MEPKIKNVLDSNGNIKSTTEYDERGNIVYTNNKDGHEVIKEYDENGRLIHYTDSTGRDYNYEYTANENGEEVMIFKDGNGYTDTTVITNVIPS